MAGKEAKKEGNLKIRPLVSWQSKRGIGLTVNGIIAQITTIILRFVGNNLLIKPRKMERLIKCASVCSLYTPSDCRSFLGTSLWLVGNDNNNSIDSSNNNVIASVPNILEMWAYLTQATFFHEVIFQIGELRPQKIRQLGQDHQAGK